MPKRCKNCKEKFESNVFLMKYCDSDPCMKAFWISVRKDQENKRKKKAVASRRVTKKKIEDLEPISYWIKNTQTIFNKFIRLRDKGNPCISCGKKINGVTHASHYMSAGLHKATTFNENNVHSGCYSCNVAKSGNLIEYRIRLIEKIGISEVENIEKQARETKKWNVEDLQKIRDLYKAKIKEFH